MILVSTSAIIGTELIIINDSCVVVSSDDRNGFFKNFLGTGGRLG